MSNIVFNSGRYTNHTSKRVINEVNRVKNKRLKIYHLLLEFLTSGDKLIDASLIKYNVNLNDNDKRHLNALLSYISDQKDGLLFLRAFNRQYKISLEDATNAINLVVSVDQPYLRDLIITDGIHKEDAEIIIDAYYWSCGKDDPRYVTIERRSIENNRDLILHILHGSCTDFPRTELKLLNISELT